MGASGTSAKALVTASNAAPKSVHSPSSLMERMATLSRSRTSGPVIFWKPCETSFTLLSNWATAT